MERVEITDVGSQLQGVGRLSDGRAVFVPGAIPGEVANIEITREKGRFCEASLSAVLEASPDRRSPACPFYGACGGCQGRHMTYERTLSLKRQIVWDALSRVGGIERPNVLETLGCEDPERYRNKAEYPIVWQEGKPVVGMHAAESNRVVLVNDCLLQGEASVRALRWLSERLEALPFARHLKGLVTRVNRAGELMLVLCADAPILGEVSALSDSLRHALPELRSLFLCHLNRRPSHALDGRCIKLWGADALSETLLGLEFEVSPQSFFQVNPVQTELLYAKALDASVIICHKTRERANVVGSITAIGDVEGKNVIIVDDMIDTAGTLCKAADVLKEKGAASVCACATHGILSGSALERIHASALESVFITDTIPHPELAEDPKIRIVSMTEVFARIIHKVYNYEPISPDFIF